MIRKLTFLCLLIAFSYSCRKEASESTAEYPFIVIKDIENIDINGIKITAQILSLGKDSISDFGFVWSSAGKPQITDNKFSFSEKPGTGLFTAVINSCINNSVSYYIRPFILGKKFLVYGDQLQFTGRGSLTQEITGFLPKEGKIGSQVVITGKNFNSNPTVLFGTTKAKVISAYSSLIVAEVPYLSMESKISVSQNNVIIEYDQPFKIITPWSQISIPSELNSILYTTGFAVNGKGFITTGQSTSDYTYLKALWEYDPETNFWNKKADFPGEVRQYALSFVLNNKAYVGFGKHEYINSSGIFINKSLNDLWEYDPLTDLWTRMADFVLPDGSPVGFSDGIWSFDPVTETWGKIPDFPGSTFSGTSFTSNNTLYGGLGFVSNSLYEYDMTAGSWKFKCDYPGKGRYEVKNFVIDNDVYIGFGSFDNTPYNDFWKFTPATGDWERLIDFPFSTYTEACFTINNKGYLFINRLLQGKFTPGFWKYDPAYN